MPTNGAVEAFLASINKSGRSAGISARRWPKSRHPSLSLVELSSPASNALLYIKVSSTANGFWGLNPNQLKRIRTAGVPWRVVLLRFAGQGGYLVEPAKLEAALDRVLLRAHDNEYKLNEGSVGDIASYHSQEYLVVDALSLCRTQG